MTFFLNKDGDFMTAEGVCMGSYIELICKDVTVSNNGVIFKTVVLHSLVHDDAEEMEFVVRSQSLMQFMLYHLKPDLLNKVSSMPKTIFGFTYVRPKINHEPLPFYFR